MKVSVARKKSLFFEKFGVCTEDYSDFFLLSPPSKISDLTNPQKPTINYKTQLLSELLDFPVMDLKTLECSKISYNFFKLTVQIIAQP